MDINLISFKLKPHRHQMSIFKNIQSQILLVYLVITAFTVRSYNIHDYGWVPSTRSGMAIDNFAGGTLFGTGNYEQTFTRSCGLMCTQTAKASDFGTLDSLSLHYDPMRNAYRDPEIGNNRDPESGMNRDPDSY